MKKIIKFESFGNKEKINEGMTPKQVWGDNLPPCPDEEKWNKILKSLAWQYDQDWAKANDIILGIGSIAKGTSSGYGG
jgi:hypothetical protein